MTTRPLKELLDEAVAAEERKRTLLSAAGALMRDAREANGLTQTEVANQIGVTRAYLSMVENGVRTPSSDVVARFTSTVWRKELHGNKAEDDARNARRKGG